MSENIRQNLEQIKILIGNSLSILDNKQINTVKASRTKSLNNAKLDFSMSLQAFIKRYAKSLSGPEKFVLLLTYYVKGDLNKGFSSAELEKNWNKMTSASLLGMKFHPNYPARAKQNDWIDSKKRGEFILRPSWEEILKHVN